MNFKKILSVILSAVIIAAALMPCASAESLPEEAEYVEGEIVISSSKEIEDSFGMLQTASDSDTVSIDFEDVGIEEIEEVETYSEEENVYLAEVDGNVEKICKELNQNKDIIAEPNYILHTCDFTMPREISGNLSMYKNYQKWYYNDIMHIPEALEKHEVTGAGVTVAVIDDGFDINATDFPTNLWRNSQGTVGWNTYKKNDDIAPIFKSDGSEFDNTSHGSNVAGIIGMPPNSKGGIGAAYGAELMLIQAANYNSDTSSPSFTNSSVANAIDYARENGADIINLSLGSTSNVSAISSAVTRAVNAGIVVVASAGNSGKATSSQKFYPASLSNVIGVMAIDKDNPSKLASFSNYDVSSGSQYYNIAAPGVAIFGCKNSSQYTLNNGTSQAAPLVAAACALYMEKYPDNTAAQLKSDMFASATETVTAASSTSYIYKSLNVLKFLDYFEDSHVWSAWTTVTAASCTAQGTEERTCSHCNKTEARIVEPLGHLYTSEIIAPGCEADGYTRYTCERCGNQYTDNYVSATGHSYSDWYVSSYPSESHNGTFERECEHCHNIESVEMANAILNCDQLESLLSGFNLGMTADSFIQNYTDENIAEVSVTPSAGNLLGTGSEVTVTYPGGQVITYYILIFGDINGDGWYDGMDAMLASCIANGMLTQSDFSLAEYIAADCNHDGIVDQYDIEILTHAGLLERPVNQSIYEVEQLETSSDYSEYLNLIEQTPETEAAEVVEEEPIDPQFSYSFIDSLIEFIKQLIEKIKDSFVFIEKLF